MKKQKNNLDKKFNLICKIVSIILAVSSIVAISFVIYFEILPLTFLSIFIIISGIIVMGLIMLMNSKFKKIIRNIIIVLSIILTILFIFVSVYSIGTLNMFNDIFDLGLRTDTYSIYVLNNSTYETIEELKNKKIGVTEDESEEINSKLDKIIDVELLKYDNSIEVIENLEDNKVDAIVILDTTMELLKEENKKYNNLKSIYTFSITTKVETIDEDVDISKDNFILYISGIDTNGKVSSKARSDVNILVAVNPIKKEILILNTPRDYYIKLPSKDAYDKLTHAGVYGIEESIAALEELYDTTINYYIRVNFTTFVKIVDALDGIKVNVPNSFCEQTSSRDSEKEICLKKGIQTLNGEEALALSRTRHIYADGDRSRIKNQMLVLEALIDKAISPKILTKYTSIISNVSDSVVTNIDDKDITKLIKSQIEDNSTWNIETYSVNGTDASKPIYSAGKVNTYVMEPNIETVLIAKEKLRNILENN